MSDLKPIRTEADYEAALAEVERLWGAPAASPEGDRLDVLATLIDAYESEHFPMDPPDPIEAIKFRMEQQGLSRKDLEGLIGTRTPGRRGAEPAPEPVHQHDPAPARATRHLGGCADPADAADGARHDRSRPAIRSGSA